MRLEAAWVHLVTWAWTSLVREQNGKTASNQRLSQVGHGLDLPHKTKVTRGPFGHLGMDKPEFFGQQTAPDPLSGGKMRLEQACVCHDPRGWDEPEHQAPTASPGVIFLQLRTGQTCVLRLKSAIL